MPSIDSALLNLLGSSSPLGSFTPSSLLAERIEFVAPLKRDSYMEDLRLKYSPINNFEKSAPSQVRSASKELYNKDSLQLKWRQRQGIGCGLVNAANTCYLNSTLQCLLYTPPLINYLITDHKKHCRTGGFCINCGLLQLYHTVNNSSGGACRPSSFIHHLKLIAKHFCFGRQEDAHEFLIHLRDKMIQQFLSSHPKADKKCTSTPTHAVFGGKLVSTVTCSQCQHQSDTKECFLELGLDVRNSDSIQQSFNRLCKRETLSGSNAYKCEKCKKSVIATKQFKIAETPNVLVLHLKRFQFGGFIGKLKNQISFPEHFDIANWSKQKDTNTKYSLYAVLVHAGSSAQCGHYYCFVKSPNGTWHCMNDTSVNTVSLQRVLQSEAYLLFYIKHETSPSNGETPVSNGEVQKNSTIPTANGHSKPKAWLMESNPFFSEKAPLTSQRPIKFNMKVNSKFLKNPYLSSKSEPEKKNFVGPLLPNGATKSNGYSSQHLSCQENGRAHPNSGNANEKPCQKTSAETNGVKVSSEQNGSSKSESSSSPVVKCTESMSSLDILKNSYNDESDEKEGKESYNPNSKPVLLVKKKVSGEQNGAVKKEAAGNVFERLGAKQGVKSWSGEKSENFKSDTDSWKSVSNPNKRVRDEYDDELDQGKMKKVKHHKNKHNGREKHDFQKAHEYQKNQNRWEERTSWGSKQNGGKYPKYFWKNKKQKS